MAIKMGMHSGLMYYLVKDMDLVSAEMVNLEDNILYVEQGFHHDAFSMVTI